MSAADLNEECPGQTGGVLRVSRLFIPRRTQSPQCSLQEMADHNVRELGFDVSVQLDLKRPVIADGRMQPHEWLLTADRKMLKTDSGSHGDDHFFPGPTDIAWDLAGAIVEWEMTAEQSSTFLELYRQKSGDDAASRIEHFVMGVFRLPLQPTA